MLRRNPGAGWTIGDPTREGRQLLLDDYEGRSGQGWHRHATLTLLAVVRAAELNRAPPKKSPRTPGLPAFKRSRGLSLPEIRRLLWRLVLCAPRGMRRILAWSHWQRYHQWVAQSCHRRRQYLKLQQMQL